MYAVDTATINIPAPAQLIRGPFYLNKVQCGSDCNSSLIFEFNTNISNSQGRIRIGFSDNNTANVRLNDHAEKYDVKNNFLYVYPSNQSEISPPIEYIRIKNITSESRSIPVNHSYNSPTRVATIASDNRKRTINQGSNIVFKSQNETQYLLSKTGGDVVRKINTTSKNSVYKFGTNTLEPGFYSFVSTSGYQNTTIELTKPTIDIDATGSADNSQVTVDIEQEGASSGVVLNVTNSSSVVYRDEILIDKNSSVSRSISVPQSGNYSISVYDPNTGEVATQDVSVVEAESIEVLTSYSQEVFNGDFLNLSINSTYNHSSVSLSSSNGNLTALNFTTTDTGPTPITINTYASPESPSGFVTTGSDVSIESIAGDTDSISPGTYDITVRSEHGTAATNDTATVTVAPRSTTDLTAYTTRETGPGGFKNATTIRNAIADGTLTEATTAGVNDTVVYGVNATGLTGLPAAANASLDRGADLDRLDGLSFGVARINASEGTAPAERDALGPVPDESTVHLDRSGLFLVVDGKTAFGTETLPADGETFEAGFSVDDERLNRTGDDDSVTTRLTYAANAVDEPVTNESANGSGTTPSTETDPAGSGSPTETGTAAGPETRNSSDVSGASGVPGGSGGSGGLSVPGGGGSDATETPSNGSDQGPANGSRGPVGNRTTASPGTGIVVAPGPSEASPSAGLPALFGTDGTPAGEGSSSRESGLGTDRTGDEGGSELDSEAATGETESVDAADPSDSDEDAASDLGYDDAPIRSTAYDLPGFGSVGALAAVVIASLLVSRRA